MLLYGNREIMTIINRKEIPDLEAEVRALVGDDPQLRDLIDRAVQNPNGTHRAVDNVHSR
jgi:hypothetical protein